MPYPSRHLLPSAATCCHLLPEKVNFLMEGEFHPLTMKRVQEPGILNGMPPFYLTRDGEKPRVSEVDSSSSKAFAEGGVELVGRGRGESKKLPEAC